jgi:hypothetical protein
MNKYYRIKFNESQAKLGEIQPEDIPKVGKKLGALTRARWMGTLVAGLKAELFKAQVPPNVMSEEEFRGFLYSDNKTQLWLPLWRRSCGVQGFHGSAI